MYLFKVCLSACVFLQAAVKALETAKDLGHKTLEIKTDSKYTINGKDLTHAACWLFCLILFISMDIYHSRRTECIRSHQGGRQEAGLLASPAGFSGLSSSKVYTSLCIGVKCQPS